MIQKQSVHDLNQIMYDQNQSVHDLNQIMYDQILFVHDLNQIMYDQTLAVHDLNQIMYGHGCIQIRHYLRTIFYNTTNMYLLKRNKNQEVTSSAYNVK